MHVHRTVTDVGLSPDGRCWLSPVRSRFLFPTAALSQVFRGMHPDVLASVRRGANCDRRTPAASRSRA